MSKPVTAMSCVEIDAEIRRLNDLITWARMMSAGGDPAGNWVQIIDILLDGLEAAHKESKLRC